MRSANAVTGEQGHRTALGGLDLLHLFRDSTEDAVVWRDYDKSPFVKCSLQDMCQMKNDKCSLIATHLTGRYAAGWLDIATGHKGSGKYVEIHHKGFAYTVINGRVHRRRCK